MVAALLLRVAPLWVLTGAVLKLVTGSPRDLPALVRDLPLDDVLTFRLAISAELFIAILALFLPRRAWPLLMALLVGFAALLIDQLEHASCGCWGSTTMSPRLMLGMDLTLLGLLVVARPWRVARAPRSRVGLALGLALAAAVVPWVWTFEGAAPATGEPGAGPPWIDLQVETWQGKKLAELPIADTLGELATLKDVDIVFWQQNCAMCADHLEKLAWERETKPSPSELVLLRMRYLEHENEVPSVKAKPEGLGVHDLDAPARPEWTLTPPVHVVVVDGVVVEVLKEF